MKIAVLLMLAFMASFNLALAGEICNNKNLGKIPVQSAGRVKPFLVLAQDRMQFITSNKKEVRKNGLRDYCELSLNPDSTHLNRIKVKIYNNDVKKVLGMDSARKSSFLSLSKFLDSGSSLSHAAGMEKDKGRQKIYSVYFERLNALRQVLTGNDFKIFIDGQWIFPREATDKVKLKDYFLGNTSYSNSKVGIEYYYTKIRPFAVSIFLVFISMLLMLFRKNVFWVIVVSAISLDVQLLAMIFRGYIASRIPLSNMYETVMFAGFSANLLGLIFYYFRREKIILLIGLVFNFFSLFMMQFATSMLDSSINPLMPVLKNNFWLGIHVFTVIVAYASFGASWLMSNYAIIMDLLGKKQEQITGVYQQIISDCLRVGVVFLSAGILTGGMWADFAWGRFWGWDPKEVWSLIVLLVYMIILHGMYTNWIDKRRFVFVTAPAFLSVMMAWFGVNYVLATGLHSYGFSQGGTIFFFIFVLTQLLLSTVHFVKNQMRKA